MLGKHSDRALARFRAAVDRRTKRYLDFAAFRDGAESRVRTLTQEDEQIAYFLPYGFYVLEGGKTAGFDETILEVKFGNRPFDAARSAPQLVGGDVHRPLRLFAEQGAALRYQRGNDGHVVCLLYPATSERETKAVSMVVLDFVRDPSRLLDDRLLRRHLKDLSAYMAATSLDGAPTTTQHLRYWWLHLAKRCAVDDTLQPRRLQLILGKLALWVATVAFSGVALFWIQRTWPEKDAVSPAVLEASKAAQRQGEAQIHALEQIRDALAASAAHEEPPPARANVAASPQPSAQKGR